MSLLIAYTLLIVVAMLWIVRDSETIFIFDVFGKNFHWVSFESGQRWKCIFTYGWRLVVLCLLVSLNGLLSYRIYVANPLAIGQAVQFTAFAVLLVFSFTPIPWIYYAQRLRWQKQLRCTAQQLDDFVNTAPDESKLFSTLDRSDYKTNGSWTAWHPKQEEWKLNRMWSGLMPVMYFRNDRNRSALFSIDWKTFLIWNLPTDCIQENTDLPICGALDSSFRVKSIKPLSGVAKWSVVYTEMCCELDMANECSG